MVEQIAFYGKGGVGKSTLISNVSAALVEAGFRVLQVGCDSKADSCRTLNGGNPIPTVSHLYQQQGIITHDSVIYRGFKGVNCIELGGLNGTVQTRTDSDAIHPLDLLIQSGLVESLSPDFVLYDISGEQSCGEFHAVLDRAGMSRVFVVTTADYASLTSVNSIIQILEQYGSAHVPVPFGGFISNGISSSFEETFIADFAKQVGSHTLGKIPRSLMVRQCELYGKTVIEASPRSNQSYFYRRLANQIVDESNVVTVKHQPCPLSHEQMRIWASEWADRLFALENGLVTDGAAI